MCILPLHTVAPSVALPVDAMSSHCTGRALLHRSAACTSPVALIPCHLRYAKYEGLVNQRVTSFSLYQNPQMSAAPGPAVATGGSDEAFSIKVESFKEIGTDYIWTLRLKGFEKNQWIYIYDKDEKGKNKPLKGFGGCKIVDLDAQVVRVKASLIVPSKLVEYEFR